MRRLYLLRHAKSDYPPGIEDRARPLNARGRDACIKIGTWLRTQTKAEKIFCSSATRTQETWQRISAQANWQSDFVVLEKLYLATAGELFTTIQKIPDEISSTMIIAHAPGIAQLASGISDQNTNSELYFSMRNHYPTAGLAVLDLPIDSWAALQPEMAHILAWITPKLLAT